MKREDDFLQRRKHLAKLSDEELNKRFWDLAEKITNPLVELGEKYTSPSIERSVLLRMGFSSIEAKAIVENIMDRGLMGKGAGNIVYSLSRSKNIGIREAGLELVQGNMWDEVLQIFKGGE